jgi:RNA polymerase sigma factor (sigma-70 family)
MKALTHAIDSHAASRAAREVTSRTEREALSPNDRELVAACLAGDEQAWHELVDRYQRLIYSIPLRQGLGRDEAADIFQAVCLDLVAELPRLRDPQALPAWLIQTTVHKVSKWRRRTDRFVADEGARAERAEAPDADMPDSLLHEVQQSQALRDAIRGLSARCRQMVQMLFFEHPPRPYKDVASELGVATGSIGFLRNRCLDKMRSALERIGVCR